MSINMIRTTISRIKRVWAITFSPGVLRGDVRFTPGNFQILSSTTQSPLPRRSKSSDSACKDRQRLTRCGGAVGSEEKDVFDDYLSPDMRANDTMHGAPPLYQTTSACRCDECNKIIAEIFGEETSLSQDNDLKRKLLANIAQVNITDNIETGKYATDKVQHGLFQRKKQDDDDSLPRLTKDNIDKESTTKPKDKTYSFDELVLMNDTLDEKSKKVIVDAHQMYTNLYDVDPEEYQCKITNNNKSPYSSIKSKDQNVDAYWKDVYETAVGENSVYCEHTLSIDEDTLNVYKVLKNTDSKLDGTLEYRRLKRSPRELEKIIAGEKLYRDSSKREGNKGRVIRATTEKQDDDKLIQKVEHIDEAPLVEAEKPKVEGSQIAPRVLGCVGKGKVFNSLDEVAKRCLTSPQNQIDEILLKEMEKLGIPLTVQRTNSCLKMDDTKPDTLNKQKKVPQEEEIELDDRDIKNKPEKWGVTDNINSATESKQGHPLNTVTQFHLDLNRTKMHDLNSKQTANLKSDTNTETVCDANNENNNGWSYWCSINSQKQDPKRSGTAEQEHTFADQMWQKNQLDPKHVLTCNETCSISPKPLIHKVEDAEVTEDMYEQQQVNLYMKQKPLLEEGESEPLTTRTEDRSQPNIKPDYLNRSKTVDFTDIMKDNASTTVGSVEQQISEIDSALNMVPLELPRREVDIEPKEEPKNPEDVTEPTIITAVDSEQLQLTTEQLQAASEQLQATCEHLQATTEQLQAATTQLQATSHHLCDSSGKLCTASENINSSTEKLQYTSENLRDSSEQLCCDKQMLINKISNNPKKESYDPTEEAERTVKIYEQFIKKTPSDKEQLKIASTETFINDTIKSAMDTPKAIRDLSVNPAAAALISKAVSSYLKDTNTDKLLTQAKGAKKENPEKTKDDNETALKELDDKCFSPNIEGWAQQATTINPSVPMTEDLPPIKPLPEINENIKLSELLKMVRERNRLVDCREATVLVKPKKIVPPLSKPLSNPPNFQMPSIPDVKPFPKTCPQKKKGTTKKCSRCNLETLGLDQNTSFIGRNESRECFDVVSLDHHHAIDLTLGEDDLVTDLADDFILQLHNLGNTIESSYKRGKVEVLEAAVLETRHMEKIIRSQDYDPWSPIPSWPYPKKSKREKLQCPKDGCQIPPPLSVEERPCGLKPCKTFPTFPKRTFSLLDCYPTSLSNHKIVEVGDF